MSGTSSEENQAQPEPTKLKHSMSWGYPMPMMYGGMMPLMHPMMHPMMFGMPLQPTQQPLPIPKKKKLDCYEIDLERQIGTGFSSVVYRAVDTRNNQEVCIKAVDQLDLPPRHKAMVISEIAILKQVDCENVLKCLDVLESKQFCYIVTELCDEGDLFKRIKKEGAMPEQQAKKHMKGLANALLSLKKKGVIHRDIKPSNVLLKGGKAKLADFGFAVFESKLNEDVITNLGSPIYMAPEVLFENKYSYASDVFAFGITFYELLHLITPWECQTEDELRKRVAAEEQIKFKEGLTPATIDLIQKCLTKNPAARITIEQIVEMLATQQLS